MRLIDADKLKVYIHGICRKCGQHGFTACCTCVVSKVRSCIDDATTVELPSQMPMGDMTYAVACAICKHQHGEPCCDECLCEVWSHFQLDAEAWKILREPPKKPEEDIDHDDP